MPGVFISHNHEDKPFVKRLKEDLKSHGIHVWVDEDEMNVGDSLTQKIETGIKDNDFVIGVISHNSIDSKWVQKELSISMVEEIESNKPKVLPIRLDDCEMPPMLSDKIYADFITDEKYDEGLSKLLKAILPEKRELAHIDNIIHQFVYSIKKDDSTLFEREWQEVLDRIHTSDGEYLKPRVIKKFKSFLKDQNNSVCLRALKALGDIGDPSPSQDIIPLISSENQEIKHATIEALGRIRAQDAVDQLLEIIETSDIETVKKVVEALGKIGDLRAVKPIIKMLTAIEPLFRLNSEYMRYMKVGPVPIELKKVFEEKWNSLSNNAQISGQYPLWKITSDDTNKYAIEIEGTWFKVFKILTDIEKETSEKANEALVNIGEDAITELIKVLHNNAYFGGQAVAEVLGKIGNAATTPLIEALKSDNPEVQRLAVKTLGYIGDVRATLPLVKLHREGSGEFDYEIIQALGNIGDKEAVDALLRHLESGSKYNRVLLIEALGKIGDSRALEPLFIILEQGESHEKNWVLHALGKIGDIRAVGPIFEYFKRESDSRGNNWRPWFHDTHLDQLIDENCTDIIGHFLQDDNENIRELSAHYLKKIGPKSTEVILQALQSNIPEVRYDAIQLLGYLKDRKATERLVPLLTDSDLHLRKVTIEALTSIHDPEAIIPIANTRSEEERSEIDSLIDMTLMGWNDSEAVGYFIELLEHPNQKVHKPAIISLHSMKHKDAIEPLKDFQARCTDIKLRRFAIRVLSDFEDDEVFAIMNDVIKDPDPEIRHEVVQSMSNNDSEAATELLCEALRDPELDIRKEAASYLSPDFRKDSSYLNALLQALKDNDDQNFIQEVTRNIGKIGDRQAIEPLIKMFETSQGRTREVILMALSDLGGPKVTKLCLRFVDEGEVIGNIVENYITGKTESDSLELLIEAMDSESSLTKELVALTLGRLNDSRALVTLEKYSDDPNEDVRYSMNWAIREIKWERLFSLDNEYNQYLEEGTIKKELKKVFGLNSQPLKQNAKLTKMDQNSWEVTDGKNNYIIVETRIGFAVYKP